MHPYSLLILWDWHTTWRFIFCLLKSLRDMQTPAVTEQTLYRNGYCQSRALKFHLHRFQQNTGDVPVWGWRQMRWRWGNREDKTGRKVRSGHGEWHRWYIGHVTWITCGLADRNLDGDQNDPWTRHDHNAEISQRCCRAETSYVHILTFSFFLFCK